MKQTRTRCFLLGILCAFFNSCAKNLEPDQVPAKAVNSGIAIQPLLPGETLVSTGRSAAYHIYTDGIYNSSSSISLTIPSNISKVSGGLKDGSAKIILNDTTSNKIECFYVSNWNNTNLELQACFEDGLEINSQNFTLFSGEQIKLEATDGDKAQGTLEIRAIVENQTNSSQITLNASKEFSLVDVDNQNSTYTLKTNRDFTIPSQIEVTKGTSINALSKLSIKKPNHFVDFYCLFEGEASAPGFLNLAACYLEGSIDSGMNAGEIYRVPSGYYFELELLESDENQEVNIEHEIELR